MTDANMEIKGNFASCPFLVLADGLNNGVKRRKEDAHFCLFLRSFEAFFLQPPSEETDSEAADPNVAADGSAQH